MYKHLKFAEFVCKGLSDPITSSSPIAMGCAAAGANSRGDCQHTVAHTARIPRRELELCSLAGYAEGIINRPYDATTHRLDY